MLDRIEHQDKILLLHLQGKRKVLSTSPLNGGITTHLTTIFNYDSKPDDSKENLPKLRGNTYEEHLQAIIHEDYEYDPHVCTGFMTAAQMSNVAICQKEYKDFSVTAVVTGGIEINAGRVGDPTHWHEREGKWEEVPIGTINIMLLIDANLTDGAITRALVTCTEAKTAAIQELCIPSCYSEGLATGSGTDGTIIVSNMDSKITLTEAGKHCKLGEYIGLVVKEAVKEALYKQTQVDATMQHSVSRRLGRFGYPTKEKEPEDRNNRNVVYASLYAHLLDQVNWGLLSENEALEVASELLERQGKVTSAEEWRKNAIIQQKNGRKLTSILISNIEKPSL